MAGKEPDPADVELRSARLSDPAVEMVRVLREDPGLAVRLSGSQLEHASRAAVAPLVRLPTGVRDLAYEGSAAAYLGLLVLDGLMARHVVVGEIASSEILGRGDVLQPRLYLDGSDQGATVRWEVLVPTRIADLDRDFADRVRAWPEIASALLDRVHERADSQVLYSVCRQARRVEDRVLFVLAHFADRWGEDTPEGRVAPTAKITGEVLARIVGARRQSVSTALGALVDRGAIKRRADGSVVLLDQPRHLQLVQAEEQPAASLAGRRETDRKAASG